MKNFKALAVCTVAALFLAFGARAEGLVTFKVMSPDLALKLAQAALTSCRGKDFQVAVAVVDRFGVLQVLLRDRYAGPHTPETARRKAFTAVSFRADTLSLAAATQGDAGNSGVRFVADALMLGGGVPVEAAGSILGGIGVSGALTSADDDACARSGIEAITDDIAF